MTRRPQSRMPFLGVGHSVTDGAVGNAVTRGDRGGTLRLGVSPPDRQLKVGAPAALGGPGKTGEVAGREFAGPENSASCPGLSRVTHQPERSGLPSAVCGEAWARSVFPSGVRPTPAVGYPIHWVALGREQGKEQPEDRTLKMAHAASAIEYPLQDHRTESSRAALDRDID